MGCGSKDGRILSQVWDKNGKFKSLPGLLTGKEILAGYEQKLRVSRLTDAQ
jgi:hypothetical protein